MTRFEHLYNHVKTKSNQLTTSHRNNVGAVLRISYLQQYSPALATSIVYVLMHSRERQSYFTSPSGANASRSLSEYPRLQGDRRPSIRI
jgi:hypothetical protein